MALKTDIRGMVHIYPDYFVVGREKVREYAKAVKSEDPASLEEKPASELGHDALVAPLTFASVFRCSSSRTSSGMSTSASRR